MKEMGVEPAPEEWEYGVLFGRILPIPWGWISSMGEEGAGVVKQGCAENQDGGEGEWEDGCTQSAFPEYQWHATLRGQDQAPLEWRSKKRRERGTSQWGGRTCLSHHPLPLSWAVWPEHKTVSQPNSALFPVFFCVDHNLLCQITSPHQPWNSRPRGSGTLLTKFPPRGDAHMPADHRWGTVGGIFFLLFLPTAATVGTVWSETCRSHVDLPLRFQLTLMSPRSVS